MENSFVTSFENPFLLPFVEPLEVSALGLTRLNAALVLQALWNLIHRIILLLLLTQVPTRPLHLPALLRKLKKLKILHIVKANHADNSLVSVHEHSILNKWTSSLFSLDKARWMSAHNALGKKRANERARLLHLFLWDCKNPECSAY